MSDAVFAEPPRPVDHEWPGAVLGVSNTVTRIRGPVQVDRTVGADLCRQKIQLARRAIEGPRAYVCDAVVHGQRVRLFSDSHHVADFWTQNWHDAQSWRERTGQVVPSAPIATVYATTDPSASESRGLACPDLHASVLFNCSFYGAVRAEALRAAARVLAEEFGAHLVRASAAASGGRGLLFMGARRTTNVLAQVETQGARFHSDDVVVLRYALRRKAGGWFVPVVSSGALGHRVFEWIEKNAGDAKAVVRGLMDDGRPLDLSLGDLETGQMRALAYGTERRAYVRTGFVRTHPRLVGSLLQARFENAPERGRSDGAMVELAQRAQTSVPPARLVDMLDRMCAEPETRAIWDPMAALGKSRTFANPMEPLHVETVTFTRAEGPGGGAALSSDQFVELVQPESEPERTLCRLLHRCAKVVEAGTSGRSTSMRAVPAKA